MNKAHGREGELAKLNSVRNDPTKPNWLRANADKNHAKIVAQLKDKKLMLMRERLIKAAQAGDAPAQARIQMEMRYYLGEDTETGLYEQD